MHCTHQVDDDANEPTRAPHTVATQNATPHKSLQRCATHAGGPRFPDNVHLTGASAPGRLPPRCAKTQGKKRSQDPTFRAAITDDLAAPSNAPTPTMSIPFCASTAAAKRPAAPVVVPPDAARASERPTRFTLTAACAAWLVALAPENTRTTTRLRLTHPAGRCQGTRRWTGAGAFKSPTRKAGLAQRHVRKRCVKLADRGCQ